jgi:peptidoglycan/LPS O-acetylase OafA/YrhL
VAVAGVLLSHFAPGCAARIDSGGLGVQLFFVLSGFLITGLLIEARERIHAGRTTLAGEWRTFIIRRTLRIFPLYYAVVLLGLVFNVEDMRHTAAWLLTYTYNFRIWLAGGWPDRLLAHFWSLAVEEQFYLVWPWLVLCAPRRLLPWAMVGLIPAALAFRLACDTGALGPPTGQMVLLPSCWDLLAAGGLMALARHRGWTRTRYAGLVLKSAFTVGFAALVLELATHSATGSVLGSFDRTANAVFFAILIDSCANGSVGWLRFLLGFPAVVYLGRISYGIYIFHNFMHYVGPGLSHHLFGIRFFPREWEHVSWLSLCSVAAAALSYHLYERPWQGLKRRWSPVASSATPPFKAAPAAAGAGTGPTG